jgi:hypothetical protein
VKVDFIEILAEQIFRPQSHHSVGALLQVFGAGVDVNHRRDYGLVVLQFAVE